MLAAELDKAGKSFANFEVTGGGFIATGPDQASVDRAAEKLRYRVAFYGSTPAYRGVFDIHGVSDLGVKLHEASRKGLWTEMAAMVPDDVLDLFAVRATYDKLADAVADRFGGISDAVSIDFLPGDDEKTRRRVVDGLKRIPGNFEGFKTSFAA